MAMAKGPIFAAGGFQSFGSRGYTLLFLPDIANPDLQREGQAPVYYWLPNKVRLARKDGETGDYVFSFIHFEGVQSAETNVGVSGDKNEVTGGVFAFSTTTAPPADVLKEVQDQLLNAFRGSDDHYWGWRTPAAPMFRPVPIVANVTAVSNVAATKDGRVPVALPPGANAPPGRAADPSLPPVIRASRQLPPPRHLRAVPATYRDPNLDPFYLRVEGQGDGSVTPFAENAYSGVCGGLEAGILWQSFHMGTSVVTLHQHLKIKVVSPEVTLRIHGDWDRIQTHFSGAAHAGGLFWSADIQAQFNDLRQSGDIKVEMFVDTTLPGADKLQAELDKRSDLVFQKFMEQAQKTIFDPPQFNEKPAEASGGFLGFGGGAAFKLRVDQTHLQLNYEETRQFAYLQDFPISGDLSGIYDEIKADPANEKKYFLTFYVSDWDRKVSRVFKPVVNWPDASKRWVGEPVAFLSVQVGYPNVRGEINWDSHVFQPSDPPDAQWNSVTEMKKAEDVTNPPSGWTPDKTFVKRQIHFTEPPSADEYPFARVSVEKNVVDLDPGDYGALTTENSLDVRVDNVGMLSVGPIDLNVDLENEKQELEVELQAMGKRDDGSERDVERFRWKFADQAEPRHWMIFTGQPTFVPKYRYRVTVTVKGTLFSKGMQWQGPWEEAGGNGPIILNVPLQTDPGVVTRNLPLTSHAPRPEAPAAPSSGRLPPPRPGAPQPTTSGRRPPPAARAEPGLRGWSMLPGGQRGAPAENGRPMFESFSPIPPSAVH